MAIVTESLSHTPFANLASGILPQSTPEWPCRASAALLAPQATSFATTAYHNVLVPALICFFERGVGGEHHGVYVDASLDDYYTIDFLLLQSFRLRNWKIKLINLKHSPLIKVINADNRVLSCWLL